MKILDRYLLREFTTYLVLGCTGFIAILLMAELFGQVDTFLDRHTPALLIARLMVFQAPEKFVQILPVGMLLATFLALGQLNRYGELAAMRAAGLPLLRILLPVFGVAVVATIGAFAFNELVVPRANRERDRLIHQEVEHAPRSQPIERADVTYLGEGGRIFIMRLYLIRERRMHEVSLQEFSNGELTRRVDAAEAFWDDKRWVFTSGVVRRFENGKEIAEPFERMAINGIRERPEDFARENRNPAEMNYFELRKYVGRLRASGARVAGHLVDLHLKLALPLVNLVVIMIGGAVATRLRSQTVALGFGLSIAIAILYYVFVRLGQALGHNGAFSPYLAAWSGNIVFGIMGGWMLWQAQKR